MHIFLRERQLYALCSSVRYSKCQPLTFTVVTLAGICYLYRLLPPPEGPRIDHSAENIGSGDGGDGGDVLSILTSGNKHDP
jgi:hypothetical protein